MLYNHRGDITIGDLENDDADFAPGGRHYEAI
jgi:hypothetical protein